MTIALIAVILSLASASQSFAGFGFMLVTVSLGAQLLPVPHVVALGLPLSMLSAAQVAWRHREHIQWRWLGYGVAPGMIVGTACGFGLASQLDPAALKRVLGATVLLAVALRGLRGGQRTRHSLGLERVGSVAGGLAQGMFGVGGPVLVLLAQRAGHSPDQFRATLTTVWSSVNFALVTVMALRGRYEAGLWMEPLMALPVVWLGARVGERLHAVVTVETFQRVVLVGLMASGLSLLLS